MNNYEWFEVLSHKLESISKKLDKIIGLLEEKKEIEK